MEKGYGQGDAAIAAYVEKVFAPEDEILADVRARQAKAGLPEIQVGRLDGLLLEVIARASRGRKAVEIGTLGGYSGICLMRGLGPRGRLDTFEIEERHAKVAQESFRKAKISRRVRLHLGPALEKLPEIEKDGPFDLVFIDADKVSYPAYLAWAAEHLKVGGLVLGDNAFAFGKLANEPPPEGGRGASEGEPRTGPPTWTSEDAASVKALQTFAHELARGDRFRATIVPTAEGLAIGVKIR